MQKCKFRTVTHGKYLFIPTRPISKRSDGLSANFIEKLRLTEGKQNFSVIQVLSSPANCMLAEEQNVLNILFNNRTLPLVPGIRQQPCSSVSKMCTNCALPELYIPVLGHHKGLFHYTFLSDMIGMLLWKILISYTLPPPPGNIILIKNKLL